MSSRPETGGFRTMLGRVALAVATVSLGLPVLAATPARADTIIAAADNLRTSWYGNQPTLTPAVVGGSSFGQLFSTAITGQVYAQPLVASNTLLVATETNDVYGIDPVSGSTRWHQNYGVPFNPLDVGCGDLTPSIGITGTPAVDPATGTAYFFVKTYVSGTSGPAEYVAHAVDVVTGTERSGWPVVISGVPTNAPGATFDATYELQRPGLLLMNGVVYAAFGGHCDMGPYRGYVVGLSTTGAMTTMWASEDVNNTGSGIWMASSPLMSDAPGQIVVATGNGPSPPVGPGLGAAPAVGFGESVLRLTVQPDGSLAPTDFFTPFDADSLNLNDQDFGSGGVTGLPDSLGTPAHPHLLVTAGKQGYVYLLDRDNLGGRGAATDNVLGKFGPFGGVWSKPAVWPGDGGYVYLPTASPTAGAAGTSGYLRVYQRVVDGAGNPALSLAATSTDSFGFGSSAPIVTSDGTQSGSALVWIVHTFDGSGAFAELRAYDAVPNGGALTLRFHAPIGTASKFTAPLVDNGRVYVGTRDGHVLAFGLTGPGPALTGPSLAFPPTTLGATAQASVILTATRVASVTAISADNADFKVGTPSPSLPANLNQSDTITVPVQFTPNNLGPVAGTLSVTTDSGVSNIPMSGLGQAPTLPIGTSPASIDFGTVPGGSQTATSSVTFTNTGTTAQTVQSIKLPTAPFGVTGAPAPGTVIAAGGAIAMTVTFTPPDQSGTSPTPYADTVAMTTDQTTAAVPLAARTALPSDLVVPSTVAFGNVGRTGTASLSFTVANGGGSPMTILKSKPPVVGGFAATSTLAEGTVIPAGTALTETVTFAPAALGPSNATWTITADDGSGVHLVDFTGTGVAYTTLPPPGPGWQLNGSAAMNASTLELTGATTFEAGSAFYPTAVRSANLDVSFTSTIGGGSGADGLTLALIDPADGPTALGAIGSGLGFSGLHGVAVAIDTYPNGSVTAFNFAGVAQTASGGPPGALTFLAQNTNVPSLRSGSREVHVSISAGTLTMSLDGTTVLQTPVTLPPNVLIGFTGGTGGLTDAHSVSNVNIATYASSPPTAVAAVGGPARATVSWTAPTDASIDSYTVTSAPPTTEVTVPATQTSATISGLTNGTTYTFTVRATSSGSNSAESEPSNAVTPAGPPGAPTGIRAIRGNGRATVAWTAPVSDNGSPITKYTIATVPATSPTSVPASHTSVTVPGLKNGTSYRFTVTATNAVGPGPPSSTSTAVTPAGPPGAPMRLHASFTNGSVTVSWVAAAASGAPITSYAVRVTPGGKTFTVAGSHTHVTITGLGSGAYSFRARATNAAGTGSWSSPSNPVTIVTVQSAFSYTARYTDAQYAYMMKTAAHFHLAVQDVPKTGVAVLAYILTISRHAPTKPIGHVGNTGPHAITTTYTSATNSSTLVPVERYIVENGDDTLYVGGLLMEYFAAVEGVR